MADQYEKLKNNNQTVKEREALLTIIIISLNIKMGE